MEHVPPKLLAPLPPAALPPAPDPVPPFPDSAAEAMANVPVRTMDPIIMYDVTCSGVALHSPQPGPKGIVCIPWLRDWTPHCTGRCCVASEFGGIPIKRYRC